MRFPLIAGMAALAGAVDFDYDIRMLQSDNSTNASDMTVSATNASGMMATATNASGMVATMGNSSSMTVAMTTTMGNASSMTSAMTTTTAVGNSSSVTLAMTTTTAAPAGNASSVATTTMPAATSAVTTAAATTTEAAVTATTTPAASTAAFCSRANYESLGLTVPTDMPAAMSDEKKAQVLKVSCKDKTSNMFSQTEATFFHEMGTDAGTVANTKLCTDAGGKVETSTCGSITFDSTVGTGTSVATLQECCGVSPVYAPYSLGGIPSAEGKWMTGYYKDVACTTLAVEADFAAGQHKRNFIEMKVRGIMSDPLKASETWTLGTCYKGKTGHSMHFRQCNGTATAGHSLHESFYGTTCAKLAKHSILPTGSECIADKVNNDTMYAKYTCEVTAPEKLSFDMALTSEADFPASFTPVQLDAVGTVMEKTQQTETDKAIKAADSDATTSFLHTRTGKLKPSTSRRTGELRRRLNSHSEKGGVTTVVTVTLPASAAAAATDAIETAKASGVLAPATIKAAVEKALQNDDGTKAFAANISVTTLPVTVSTPRPASPTPGGGAGSTSAAYGSMLGFAATVTAALAVLF